MKVSECYAALCGLLEEIERDQEGGIPSTALDVVPTRRDLERSEIQADSLWRYADCAHLDTYQLEDGEVRLFWGWYDRCRTFEVRPDGNIAIVYALPRNRGPYQREFRWLDRW